MEKDHQGQIDLAWAAGIMDGEGYISLRTGGQAELVIEMCHEETISRLVGILGGNINTYKARPRVWRWKSALRAEVRGILKSLIPYLVTKKAQAQVLLNYIDKIDILPPLKVGVKRPPQQQELLEKTRLELARLRKL